MADNTVNSNHDFYGLYNALAGATDKGKRLEVTKVDGVAVWRTQNQRLRTFLNVLTGTIYGRWRDYRVAQSLATAIDQHVDRLNPNAPDNNQVKNHLITFKKELEQLTGPGLVAGNFLHKLNANLGTSEAGSAALDWVQRHTVFDLIPAASRLGYQHTTANTDRVDALKRHAVEQIRTELVQTGRLSEEQIQAVEALVDRLGEKVGNYLQQRSQSDSPAELAQQVSTAIAIEIKQHLDSGYKPEQAVDAWAVGSHLGVLLGEVEVDIPGRQPTLIALPQSNAITDPERPATSDRSTVPTSNNTTEKIEESTLENRTNTQAELGVSTPTITPPAQGVRGVAGSPSAITRPSGAQVDYFDTGRQNDVLKRLSVFEINRGRLEQVINDKTWVDQETGAIFSETEQVEGKKAKKRVERYTAFAQLSDKKQQAIFEKLEKRLHQAQLANPEQKLDADWFATQLRSSTEKVLNRRFVGVSKGGKHYHPPKEQTVQYQAKEKAKIYVQGARSTATRNELVAARGLGTRLLEGADNLIERLQGQGNSDIGFSSAPQRSKVDEWIATANHGQLREIEVDAFGKQFTRRAAAFAEVNQHWLREQDWQRLAIDTITDLRRNREW